MIKYLHFIWGFIGVIAGMTLTIFIPSIQGKWDITSLAGLLIVILFALVSSDRLKEYSERLEKQHEQLKQQLNLDFQAESQRQRREFLNEVQNKLHMDSKELIGEFQIYLDNHYHSAHLGESPVYEVTKDKKGEVGQMVWRKVQKP